MLIISNHLQSYMKLPKNAILRVNMAWIPDKSSLCEIIGNNYKHDIFLDFNSGRTKPPTTKLTFEDAIQVMIGSKNIKYFAISNAEDIEIMKTYRRRIPDEIKLVPKIETAIGILRLADICKACNTDTVMLDKDDLWISVHQNNKLFYELIKQIREQGKKLKVKILEVQGVIFAERNKE